MLVANDRDTNPATASGLTVIERSQICFEEKDP